MSQPQPIIGVIGSGQCESSIYQLALEVGEEIAKRGAILICGGLGGVMEAAAKGASLAGGITVGILPGPSCNSANPYIKIPVATDMGQARNVIIAHTADGLVAVSGGAGTLSEIGHGLKIGKPIVGLKTITNLRGVHYVDYPQEAIARIFELI
jgi:uncharacterized protein (TIGR00725 family)